MTLKIREERIGRQWSQAFVAKNIGMTKNAYANIERGIRKPSFDALMRILDFFGYEDPRKLFAPMGKKDCIHKE